jgi:peptide/nickel transport system substrate-binding protein
LTHSRASASAILSTVAIALCASLLGTLAPAAGLADTSTGEGLVRYGTIVEPETLNPLLGATLAVARVASLAFDGLVRVDADGRPVPDLAVAVPSRANGGISADGKVLTYHLEPRAKWHDGQSVTADDVVFTWHAIMNPRNNVAGRAGYDQIERVEAVDPHTVRVRLKRRFAPALFLFTPTIVGAILPKHLLAASADLNRSPFNTAPIGSGPYRVRAWRRGDRIVFERNADYFRGAPSIARIEMLFIPDTNTLLNLIRTRELDVTAEVTADHYRVVRNVPEVVTTLVPVNSFTFLSFNTRREPLNDVRVRQALCYTIDPKRIFETVYHGVGLQSPADQSPASGWADHSLRYYPTDPARAGALLDGAGWKLGSDGYRSRAGIRLSLDLTTVTGNKSAEQVEVMVQESWRRVGIDARIKNAPGNVLFAQANGILNKGTFDVALFSYALDPDPDDSSIIGPGTVPPQGVNETGYVGDAEFARLQREASGTYDVGRRHALYNRLQAILVRDVPRYTLRWQSVVQVHAKRLHGVAINPANNLFWNVQTWTLDP